MSGNVRVSVTHPEPSGDQLPLDHVRIETRVEGIQQWTEVNTIVLPATSLVLQDIAGGLWHVRAIWVDEIGQQSNPVTGSIQVPNSPPSAGEMSLSLE